MVSLAMEAMGKLDLQLEKGKLFSVSEKDDARLRRTKKGGSFMQ